MICGKCGYEWKPKVEEPKKCPRCKASMNYQKKIKMLKNYHTILLI